MSCANRVGGIKCPSSSTNSFTYNGLDTRVGKVDSSGSATYKRDGADVTDPVLSDGSALYTPGVSEHRGSATSFDHQDYLGTVSRQTNSSQTTTGTRTYDAFGLLVASSGTPQGPFGFAGGWGYQEDTDSGLKLLGHRYYDPSTGRFLTRDPVKDGRNWYCYCANMASLAVDPSGRSWGADIGGVLGTAVGVAIIAVTPGAPIILGIAVIAIWTAGGAAAGGAIGGDDGNQVYQDTIHGGFTGGAGAIPIATWLARLATA